jgi:hypothetical protein
MLETARNKHLSRSSICTIPLAVLLFSTAGLRAANVTTHNNDNFRTGWNPQEAVLTPSAVKNGGFTHLLTVMLPSGPGSIRGGSAGDFVRAQPLILSNQAMSDGLLHSTVVYIATEANNVYAIDGTTGSQIVYSGGVPGVNLGSTCSTLGGGPSQKSVVPIGHGIWSTPVIDPVIGNLYVVSCNPSAVNPSVPQFNLNILSVTSLKPVQTPIPIPISFSGAAATIPSCVTEQPPANPPLTQSVALLSQRSALGLFNGGVLVGFSGTGGDTWGSTGTFVYMNNFLSGSHGPSGSAEFTASTGQIASIWMSGAGPATTSSSNIYFITGNGAGNNTSECNEIPFVSNPIFNPAASPGYLPDSLIQLLGSSAGQTVGVQLQGTPFTPSNQVSLLDPGDLDFGSGGVLIVPNGDPGSVGPTATPEYFVAQGKDSKLYVLKSTGGTLSQIVSSPINMSGECFCAPSYYTGPNGGNVVIISGQTLSTYTVGASGLSFAGTNNNTLTTGTNPWGGFNSVSSNATNAATAVVWSAGFGSGSPYRTIVVNAFDPSTSSVPNIFSDSVHGSWPNTNSPPATNDVSDAGSVPPYITVANAHTYVASDRQLDIYGIPHLVADPATMTSGTVTQGGLTWIGYGPGTSYSQTVLTGGPVIVAAGDYNTGVGFVEVCGFQSDPGSGWLYSMTINGITKPGASAKYYPGSNGCSQWSWPSLFGVVSGGTAWTVLAHEDVVTDKATMTAGSVTQGSYSWIGYGPGTAYLPTVLSGGTVVVATGDYTSGSGFVEVCGFQNNPLATWLYSMNINGVVKVGSTASYYYGTNGCAQWSWSSVFGVKSGSSVPTALMHLL